MTWSIPWDVWILRYWKHWSLIMHVSKDSKSDSWPCQHGRTDHKQLAATQDPLRYTFINIIHGLVEVGQMRGVSTEVLKQLLHTLGVKGKGPAKISQRIHICLCCSPLWPRLPTWAASIFDVAQHLADCNKETDHCGGWPSFPFLNGWLNNNEKLESKKGVGNYQKNRTREENVITFYEFNHLKFPTTLLEKLHGSRGARKHRSRGTLCCFKYRRNNQNLSMCCFLPLRCLGLIYKEKKLHWSGIVIISPTVLGFCSKSCTAFGLLWHSGGAESGSSFTGSCGVDASSQNASKIPEIFLEKQHLFTPQPSSKRISMNQLHLHRR